MGLLQDIQYNFTKDNSAIRKLIIINVSIFLLFNVLNLFDSELINKFVGSLKMEPELHHFLSKPWSLFTYMFLHNGIFHLIGNMLWLYFLGGILQDMMGNRAVNRIFIAGGISGALLYMLLFSIVPKFANQGLPMVGASGGITAIIVAAATLVPNYEIRPFGLFSISLKWIALIKIFFDIAGLGDGVNDGGQLAHLGGAALGYFYIKYNWNNINLTLPQLFRKKPKKKLRYTVNKSAKSSPAKSNKKPRPEDVDMILDKISNSGYDSLSKEEKETLFRASDS